MVSRPLLSLLHRLAAAVSPARALLDRLFPGSRSLAVSSILLFGTGASLFHADWEGGGALPVPRAALEHASGTVEPVPYASGPLPSLLRLDEGRFFVAPESGPATLHLEPSQLPAEAHLVFRPGRVEGSWRLEILSALRDEPPAALLLEPLSGTPNARRSLPLQGPVGSAVRLRLVPQEPAAGRPASGRHTPNAPFQGVSGAADHHLVLEEVYLSPRPAEEPRIAGAVSRVLASGPVRAALFFLPLAALAVALLHRTPPSAFWVICFSTATALATVGQGFFHRYGSPGARDFTTEYVVCHLTGSNLVYGPMIGWRFLQGKGITRYDVRDPETGEIRTVTNSYRMPGYPLFCALAGAGADKGEGGVLEVARRTVYAHVLLFLTSLGVFLGAAWRRLPWRAVLLLGWLLALLTQRLDNPQSDTLILPLGLFLTAALLPFLDRRGNPEPDRAPPFRHLAAHLAFAAWFLVRTDVLPGWAAVSLFLSRRRPRLLLIPAWLLLGIGLLWGGYQRAHGGPFQPTTTNLGHVAFVGLWQVPRHPFVWEPKDASYDAWISAHGHRYQSPAAAKFALREVVRFWLTYPGYTASLFWHKFYNYFRGRSWRDDDRWWQPVDLSHHFRHAVVWVFFFAYLLSFGLGHAPGRTFLLGWALPLNLPLFCLLQESGGRFVPFVTASLLIAAAPLLFEREFLRKAWRKRRRILPWLVLFVLVVQFGDVLDEALMDWDAFRFASPFLDPADSTLAVFRD